MRILLQHRRSIVLAVVSAFLLASPLLEAGPTAPARVTHVRGDVRLMVSAKTTHRAHLNDIIEQDTIIQTGREARTELTFPNETVVRLAANSAFSFKNGTRFLNLQRGAALIETPKRARGATLHTGAMAATLSGTTIVTEYHPGLCKYLVLEGTGRLYRPRHLGDSILVRAGQLVIGNPDAAVSDPVDFDIARFVKTSCLITDFPPLHSQSSLVAESQEQERENSRRTLLETNLVIFGGGTLVSVVGKEHAPALDTTAAGAETSREHAAHPDSEPGLAAPSKN
jgi:hypothetical protein